MARSSQFWWAIGISLLLHFSVVSSWFLLPRQQLRHSEGLDTSVDTPIELKEAGPRILTVHVRKPPAPQPLPPSVTDILPGPGPIVPAVNTTPRPAELQPLPVMPSNAGTSGKVATLHGKLPENQTVVYVLDRSSSMMERDALKRASAVLVASLRQLDPKTRFQIIGYNSTFVAFVSGFLPATPENIELAAAWLEQLRPEGRSNHLAGFREGLYQRPGLLYLLTDSDDITEQEIRSFRELLKERVPLQGAIFGPRRPTESAKLLERFIQLRGGKLDYFEP